MPWEVEDFEKDVARIIVKDCKKRPVLIVNDMVEQHYRKERVIKKGVGLMDRNSLLERKLKFAFANYPIRASMKLNETIAGSESRAPADIYIFAAIPNSDQFKMTLNSVSRSFASIVGVCLLPVEAADMSRALSDEIESAKTEKSKWVVFLSQHQSGGLRQIVTKNGEIALTRMTPMTASQDDPAGWAAEVRAEFNATMSYVSRFGYQSEDGLNVIAVANNAAGSAFEELIDDAFECTSLSPQDAAMRLGVSVDRTDLEGYGDSLHVAWLAKKKALVLPLKSEIITRVANPRKMAMAASLLMFVGALALFYIVGNMGFETAELYSEAESQRSIYQRLQVEHQKETDKKAALGVDVQLVQKSVKLHDVFDYKKLNTLPLFQKIAEALGGSIKIDGVQVSRAPDQNNLINYLQNLDGIKAQSTDTYIANMQLTYPTTANIDAGNREVKQLSDRLQLLLPDDEVVILKSLGDYEYVSEVEVKSGQDIDNVGVDQDFIVEIQIKGRTKK